MSPLWSILAFMDSGRVADEFESSIRKTIRADVLILLVLGLVLIVVGLAVLWVFFIVFVTIVLLVAGAVLITAAIALWMINP